MKKIIFISLFSVFFGNFIFAQYAYLVKDVSQMTRSSDCGFFTKVGSTGFFVADDYYHGSELWKTDGTTEGTVLVKDILPGISSGFNINCDLVDFNNTLFFIRGEWGEDLELWKSNGTESGTVIVKVLTPGNFIISDSYIVNGKLLFFVEDEDNSTLYLWKSDGTTSGTTILSTYTDFYDNQIYTEIINEVLYFRPDFGTLCKTDGTSGGTATLKTGLSTAGVTPSRAMVNLNGILYFVGYQSTTGYELFKSDGTASGTVVVKDFNPGLEPSDIGGLNVIGDYLYFGANNGVDGNEFWRSDGTAAGSVMVKDINPIGNSTPRSFHLFNGEIYFVAYNGVSYALFKTDGTNSSTVEVYPLEYHLESYGDAYYEYENELYLLDWYNNLFKTDGTYAGTHLVTDSEVWEVYIKDYGMFVVKKVSNTALELTKLNTQTGNLDVIFAGRFYRNAVDFEDKFIFASEIESVKYEPFISDGTIEGTSLLRDINTYDDSEISSLQAVNDELFFEANEVSNILWESNGHSSGTEMITDSATSTIAFNDNLLFCKNSKLWMTDVAGTEPIEIMDTISTISYSRVYNDTLFFHYRNRIYKLDPFTTTPQVVFESPYSNMYLEEFEKLGDNFYISAQNHGLVHVNLLDFTATTMFNDYYVDSKLFLCNDSLFFTADVVTYDTIWFDETEYWVNDFHESFLFKTGGLESQSIVEMTVSDGLSVNNKVFLKGSKEGENGLFCVDGTTNSITFLLSNYDYMSQFTVLNDELVFVYTDENGDKELWKSDGTIEGTTIIENINISEGSNPAYLVVKDDILFFAADDGISGNELWSSDGTAEGTQILADINTEDGSNPEKLTISGNNIYFVADGGEFGRELWAYGLTTTENCFAYFDTDYDSVQNTFTLSIDSVTIANASGYLWDFGDGNYSNEQNPTHEFSTNNLFRVCMTAYTDMLDSCKFCHEIGKDEFGNIYKTDGFVVTVDSPTDVTDLLSNNDKPDVFPNPTSQYINVVSNLGTNEKVELYLIDYTGRKVYENVFLDAHRIDVGELQPGIYLLVTKISDSKLYSEKIVIQ